MFDIDLTGLFEFVLLGFAGILMEIIRQAVKVLKAKWSVEVDTSKEGTLNRAIERGVDFVRTQALGSDGKLLIPNSNLMIKWAADYVIEKVPDTLDHFGITPDQLREMVVARFDKYFPEAIDTVQPPSVVPTASAYPIPSDSTGYTVD